VSDRILVLYLGRIVELSSGDDLYQDPKHPYTKALLTAVPIPDPKRARQRNIDALKGEIPSPINPPSGCTFRTRCRYATERCAEVRPPLETVSDGRQVACIRWKEIDNMAGMEASPAVA
jgi:oligopeptide transport system ATP-binding protein